MKADLKYIGGILVFLSIAIFTGCGGGHGGGSYFYNIGGELNGLAIGKSIILQNNGGDDLSLDADGTFIFSTKVPNGAPYKVTVKTQPDGQSCFVDNGEGVISGANVTNVSVNCYDSGSIDTSFGTNGIVTFDNEEYNEAVSATIDADGKIVVTGYIKHPNSPNNKMALWRYNTDGTADTTFGTNGVVIYEDTMTSGGVSVAIDPSGKIVVSGSSRVNLPGAENQMTIWRYDTNGMPDLSFNGTGMVSDSTVNREIGLSVTLDAQDRIVVTGFSDNGTVEDMAIWRYTNDGSPDTTFNGSGKLTVPNAAGDDNGRWVTIDSHHNIVVAGVTNSGSDAMAVWRYTENGTVDTTFGTNGVVTYPDGAGMSATIDPQGRIIVTGYHHNGPKTEMALWRYTNGGTADTAFGTNGLVTYSEEDINIGTSVIVDADGRIITTGASMNTFPEADMAIWRYSTDGVADSTFGTNGVVKYDDGGYEQGWSVRLDSDGKIIIAGSKTDMSTGEIDMKIWRYIP